MAVARAVNGLPLAADAPDTPALDLDDHYAKVGMGHHEVRLAIRRLVTGPLLEPGDVAVDGPR